MQGIFDVTSDTLKGKIIDEAIGLSGVILLRLLNITIFNSHIFQYISACYA